MTPWTAGDICEHCGWNRSTLRYWRHRGFPEPRWHVGGKRASACWRKADVIAWQRDRNGKGKTDYAGGLAVLAQLGSLGAAAKHARVAHSTFRNFLAEAGEEVPATAALRVLKLAEDHARPEDIAKLRGAARVLTQL